MRCGTSARTPRSRSSSRTSAELRRAPSPACGPSTRGTFRSTGSRASARAARSGQPATTEPEDAALLEGSPRVHLVESGWVEPMRTTRVVAYRLPDETFAPDPDVGGYWLSRETVVPVEVVELGDLVELHARSGIDLRVVENLWPLVASCCRVVARVQRYPPAQRAAGAPSLSSEGASSPCRTGAGSRVESRSSFRSTTSPSASLSSRPPRSSATRATASRSAVAPSHSTAAPPGATSGRQSSTATGGLASAFASATPNASSGCSSARPQTTSTFGSAAVEALEEVALAALGLEERERSLGKRDGQRDSRRASARADVDHTARRIARRSRERGVRRPGARGRALSAIVEAGHARRRDHAPRASARGTPSDMSARERAREHDDEAVGLGAFARRLDLGIVLQRLVDDLALDRGHRLHLDASPGRRGALRRALGATSRASRCAVRGSPQRRR